MQSEFNFCLAGKPIKIASLSHNIYDSFPQAPSPTLSTSEDIMSGLPDQYFEPQAMEDEAGETSSGHQILPTGRSLSPHERQLWSELYGECEEVLKTSSSSMNIVSASPPPTVSGSSEDLHRSELQTMELGRQGYHQNMESSVTVVATQASETPVLDASLPCAASTIQAAELHSPQHAQQILTTRAMRGAHTSQRSCRDLRSPQTATSGNSRVARASSRTRRSPLGMAPCQPRRSQRIISRATGRFGESSGAHTSVPKMPPRKGLEPPPASTSMEWEEAIYVPAWEVFNPIVLHLTYIESLIISST